MHCVHENRWMAVVFGVHGIVVPGKIVPRCARVHHHPLVADLVDNLGKVGGHRYLVPIQSTVSVAGHAALGVKRNNVFRLVATGAPSPREYVSRVSTKCPTPRRVRFSGDTDTTSSTTLSRSPSRMGIANSASLDALIIVVPGS